MTKAFRWVTRVILYLAWHVWSVWNTSTLEMNIKAPTRVTVRQHVNPTNTTWKSANLFGQHQVSCVLEKQVFKLNATPVVTKGGYLRWDSRNPPPPAKLIGIGQLEGVPLLQEQRPKRCVFLAHDSGIETDTAYWELVHKGLVEDYMKINSSAAQTIVKYLSDENNRNEIMKNFARVTIYNERCQAKTWLKAFFVAIPKDRWMGTLSSVWPFFFWYDTTLRIGSLKTAESNSKVGIIPTEGWFGAPLAQSFFWYDNKPKPMDRF